MQLSYWLYAVILFSRSIYILIVAQSIKSQKKTWVIFTTLRFIYELKLEFGTSGKNYSSALNVDRNDFFLKKGV